MDRAPDVAAREEGERIACVNSQGTVLRLYPLPLSGNVVLNLQSCNRLAE